MSVCDNNIGWWKIPIYDAPMTDSELKAQTPALKERLENGEK